MTSKDNLPGDTASSSSSGQALRQRAEEVSREKAAQSTENLETLSPEETRRTLYELQVHQIELEMQNEELRRTEVELEASRSKYFDLFDLAPVGYLTLDDKGVILEANLAAARLLETERSQCLGKQLTGFLDRKSQDIFYLCHRHLLDNGQPESCTLCVLRRDGSSVWLRVETLLRQEEESGKPLCWAILADISEQVRIDQALREKSEELDQFFQLSSDLFCIADTNGFFSKLNSQWTTTLGYLPAELEGRSFLDLVHPDDREATLGVIEQLMAQQEVPIFVNRNLCHDSTVRWLEWHFRLSGKRVFATARDITDRKQLEEQIHQVRSDLLFAVSHDLKSPLQALRQTQEMLGQLPPAQALDRFQEYGEIWRRNLQRLERMINNLVDSQRSEEGRFPLLLAPCDPVELVQRVAEDLTGYTLAFQVTFDLNLQSVPEGSCDEEALARVVENLLTNAVKFSPKGGQVEVRLKLEEKTLLLDVEDHGIGIPAEEQGQLFQPFQRGRSAQRKGIPGTGLGLYVSRRIVEEHGGTLTLKSEEGKGTVVTVQLPWGIIET